MENMDDLMRQKFDSDDPRERFEFREEYWEQAQALLEQDEAGRRIRLWLFIGLLLAMALLAWFLVQQWSAGSLSENKAAEERLTLLTEKTENEAYPNGKRTIDEPLTKPSNSVEGTLDGSIQHDGNKSASSVPANLSLGTQQSRMGNKGSTKPGNSGNTQDAGPLTGEQIAEGGNSKSPSAAQPAQKGKAGKNKIENTPAGNTTQGNDPSPITNPPFTNPPITNPPITNPPVTNPPFTNPPFTNPPFTNPPITNPPITNPPITNPPFTNPPFTNPPTPLTLFIVPEQVIVPRKLTVAKEPIAEKTKPVQDQRFSFGLSLAVAAYQQPDTAGRWAGWAIGAFGNYRLNDHWSLMLGVQGRFVPGQGTVADSSNPNQVEQLRYSFGYRRESWSRETRGLYYLEMPLSACWHKGPWSLEGGAAAGKLLSVRDRTEYTVESSLEGKKTETKKFAKSNVEAYNRTYLSGFAGAEYRLNNRFSVTSRAQYRFTPVFKTLGEGVKNKGLGNVELGLRARLF